MALSLYDHERRLEDLEVALEALRRLVVESGEHREAVVAESERRLRTNGHARAAGLLEGARHLAPYRR